MPRCRPGWSWAWSQSAMTQAIRSNAAGRCGRTPAGSDRGGEQLAHDPQARALLTAADDLLADGSFEPGRPKAAGALQVAAVTVDDHGQGGHPGRGAERPFAASRAAGHTHSSRSRICWTHATCSSISCSRRVPRCRSLPRSHRPVRAGSSAAERSAGRSGPRPCRRSCRWSGPRSCAPTLRCAGWTHTNDMPRWSASWLSIRHRCPVGSHATVTPAKPARVAWSAAQSKAAPRSHALHRNVRRASTLESWSVTTTICLRSARSIPTIAFVTGTAARSRTRRAFLFRSPRETPLPLLMNVLLLATMGHQARQAHQEDVPHARPEDAQRLPMPMCGRFGDCPDPPCEYGHC